MNVEHSLFYPPLSSKLPLKSFIKCNTDNFSTFGCTTKASTVTFATKLVQTVFLHQVLQNVFFSFKISL